MLDDDNRISSVGKAVKDIDQLMHVRKMQTGGGLVQNVNGLSGAPLAQLRRQLDALRLAAGQGGRGLTQLHVGQAHIIERFDFSADGGHIFEEVYRFLHGHIQHIKNTLSLVLHIQGLAIIALAAADLTGHIHIGKEVHLDLDDAVAAAGLTPASLHIEAEPALFIAPCLRVGRGGEQIPDHIEHPGVGGGIGTGRAADGRLIDVDHLIQLINSLDPFIFSGNGSGTIQVSGQRLVEDLVHQRAFAGAGNTGHTGHHAERKTDVDILQVIFRSSFYRDPARGLSALRRNRNGKLAA